LICIKKTRRSRFRVLVVPSHDLMHINALAARYWKCRPNIRLVGARHATPPHIAFSKRESGSRNQGRQSGVRARRAPATDEKEESP
jgi:hypothetical protein